MLSRDDIQQMRSDLTRLCDDSPTAIVIRRGTEQLTEQIVRLVERNQGAIAQGEASQEANVQVMVVGGIDLDIRPGDRFTVSGVLYRVSYVLPDRKAGVFALAAGAE